MSGIVSGSPENTGISLDNSGINQDGNKKSKCRTRQKNKKNNKNKNNSCGDNSISGDNNHTKEDNSATILTDNHNQPIQCDETNIGLNKTNKELYDLVKFTVNKFTELHKPNISKEDMYYNIFKEVNKHYKIAPKKRQRRIIPENNLCMGRKLDTLQCTRRRLNGKEYCKSHCKKLTNGRIDAPVDKPRTVGKRGRKRKTQIDPKYFDDNYKTFFPCVIEGKKYLSDINNHIFEFVEGDNTKVRYLGILSLDGKIESVDPIDKC